MKRKGFWLATGILVIPVVVFYMLNAGTQNFEKLPILGERIPPDGVELKDTLYHTVPQFSFIDQEGKTVDSNTYKNSIVVANFFFANCEEICPAMNRRLQTIYDKFGEFAEIKFLSISVDPLNDSVPVLKTYAARYGAKANIWHFVTGSPDEVVKAGQGFLLPVSKEDKTIDHSQQFILMDKQRRIRGVYDSGSDAELKRLEGELKVLLYEYHNPGSKR
ncbi:MAG: SCO family protein [Bacteroidia bacterium]|nr:SCO family protein [Bacteroidia bacterium]